MKEKTYYKLSTSSPRLKFAKFKILDSTTIEELDQS